MILTHEIMSSKDVESGFEALLKPLQDITSKMWDIMLTTALEKYLVQINNGDTSDVNFTEAAVLVQNSASFYCKRVDSVHLGCRQFVEKLINTYISVFGSNQIMDKIIHENFDRGKDKEEGEDDAQAVKKKKKPKVFINDNFEPIDLFYSDSNIDVNLDTIDKYADQKKVILNKFIKASKKPNTSCPVFQTKGSEMGLKEEFRLHWGISSSGILNEDFVTTKIPRTVDWLILPDDIFVNDPEPDELRNSFSQLENNFAMDVDEIGPPPSSPHCLAPSPIPPNSPLTEPPPPLPSENIPLKTLPSKDYYVKRKFNFVIPPKALLKNQVFSVPKSLISEISDWKKRKIESQEHINNPYYSFNTFFNFMKHHFLFKQTFSEDAKCYLSAKRKRQEIKLRQKQYEKAVAGATENVNDDFYGFNNNLDEVDNFDDIQIENVEDLVVVDVPEIERDINTHDREEMMAAFQENKRRFAAELTEVARRVQAWHESLANVLEAAEARSQYDVHQYGTSILDVFNEPPDKKPIVSFQNIFKDQPGISKAEVSRYLLSSLMLANTYNVKIIQDDGELVKDCLRLQLLSTVRHHEEMDENLKSNTHC